ncbi:hypothetical protein T484DRAFT_3640724 [Baffinella frigidus]|nr:hypothetical protein T484DRAFT_3640724 [Cryptophyta sp. CCMP2293]
MLSQITAPKVPFNHRIPREHHLCDPASITPLKIEGTWWMPYLSTAITCSTEEEEPFPIPKNNSNDRIMWMYSIESESKAFTTIPPTGLLQQIYPNTHTTSRFHPFSIANAQAAFKSSLPPPQQTKPTIIPLGFQDPRTLSQIQVYRLVREAVFKLRSAKAWKLDTSKHVLEASLNLVLVRQLFSNLTKPCSTIRILLIPLSQDHMRNYETPEEQQSAFRNAFEFLKEVALSAFETNNGTDKPALRDETTAPFNHRFSGDIRPNLILNSQGILKHKNTEPILNPFNWPDFPSIGSTSGLRKRKQQASAAHEPETTTSPQKQQKRRTPSPPDPATNSQPSNKRPNTPFPWEYCSKCWEFAEHYTTQCNLTSPKDKPETFRDQLRQLKQKHQHERKRQRK